MCGERVLDYVIKTCQNIHIPSMDIDLSTVILCPYDDQIISLYKDKVNVLEGDENDVLSRYVDAIKIFDADYILSLIHI